MAEPQACVLLTGAAGFLGKVILEELQRLQSLGELPEHRLVLLIRPSKQYDPAARFEKLTKSKCFSDLGHEWTRDIRVVPGELTSKDCGLGAKDYAMVCESVTHIIHCASSIDFNLPIAEAATSNIETSLNLLRLTNDCYNLRKVVLVSTAYVHPHQDEHIKEVLAPLPESAEKLYATITAGCVDERELLALSGHANTYTLTKSISEHLVKEFKCNVPVSILRPSIISAAWKHPFPGWIDSRAALGGYAALFGAGFLHVMEGDPKTNFDIVPVDVVAKDAIIESGLGEYGKSAAQQQAATRTPQLSIRHSVSGQKYGAPAAKMIEVGVEYFGKHAVLRRAYWKYMGPKGVRYHWHRLIHQQIPLNVANVWYGVKRDDEMQQKIRLVRKGIQMVDRCFPYFCSHTFGFEGEDRFDSDFICDEYLRVICVGVHRHLLLGDV